jgi:hypothetical protein
MERSVLDLLASTGTRPGLFRWAEKVAGLLPEQVVRHLPMLREWSAGRETPRAAAFCTRIGLYVMHRHTDNASSPKRAVSLPNHGRASVFRRRPVDYSGAVVPLDLCAGFVAAPYRLRADTRRLTI